MQKILLQGMWIRPEILKLLQNKTISSSEFTCLMYIDNIIITSGDFFSYSNAWLGHHLGLNPRQITGILSHLKELSLIYSIGFDGRKRKIMTIFQRLDLDNIRKNELQLEKGNSIAKNCYSDREHSKKLLPSYISISLYLIFIRKNTKKLLTQRVAKNCYAGHLAKSLFGRKKYHPRWKTYSKKLAKAVQDIWNFLPNDSGWYRSIEKLQSEKNLSIPRIKKVLDWYCKAIRSASEEELEFLPYVKSGAQFLGKFLSIEIAMKKEQRHHKKFMEKAFVPGGPIPITTEIVGEYDPDEDEEGAWQ